MRIPAPGPPLLFLSLLAVPACSDSGRESSHPAARVSDWTLTSDRLAELLVLAQPFPLEESQVTPIVRVWVDLAALTQAVARGTPVTSDELILAASWNEVRQEILAEFRARELGARTRIRPQNLDSVYFGDDVRAVAHVLRKAGPEATNEQRREQYAWAQEIRRRLVEGAPWDEANQMNQDLESQARGGLMLLRRDQVLPQISEIAFSLRPGELSQVFASPEGYHLLVRPRLEEVRGALGRLLAEEEMARAESEYAEDLAAERGLTVLPGAAAIMRRVAADPLQEVESPDILAGFEGGELTAGQAARYLYLLPEEIRPELLEGPDWGLEDFVRQLASQELLWRTAEASGIELSEEAFASIKGQYLAQLDTVWAALGLDPGVLARSERPLAERERSAARQLDLYMEMLLGRVEPVRNVPTFLAIELLQRLDWEVRSDGIREAIASAARLLDLAGYEDPG
jgi:hypothetical protein